MFKQRGYASLSYHNDDKCLIDNEQPRVDDQEHTETDSVEQPIELGFHEESTISPMTIFSGRDPFKYSIKELQEFCKSKQMKTIGNKKDLIVRLLTPPSHSRYKKGRIKSSEVHTMLENAGVTNLKRVNKCLKAAIRRGCYHIDGSDSLDQIILEASCKCCEKKLEVTMRDALYQKCHAVECGEELCATQYLIALCAGTPKLDLRKACICSIWEWW